jgi:cytochrome P450 family 135
MKRAAHPALPPGPVIPLAVQTLLFWWKLDWFLANCARRFGPIFTLHLFPWGRVVMVADPDAIKTVFTGDTTIWRAGESYELLAPLIGEHSIVLLDGDEHLSVRKRMLPPFHGQMLGRYEQLVETIAAQEVADWPIDEPIALVERMRAITLEVMLRTVIGAGESKRLDELRGVLADAVHLRPLMLLMWAWSPLQKVGPWRDYNVCLSHARRLIAEEVADRRADPLKDRRTDILSSFLCAGELADYELLDQLATLLLAGHDTSTTALAWAIERLVRHPAALARAREDESYLDAVVKETLRVRPVLPAVSRRLAVSTKLAGYSLPAGTTVVPAIRLVHSSPQVYPEPEAFRPERFLEGQGQGYTWIPFGGGTRRCIGAAFAVMQMRVVLRTILQQAELRPDRPDDEPVCNDHITLIPGRGCRVVKVADRPFGRRIEDDPDASAGWAAAVAD